MEDMIPCPVKDQEVFQRVWQRVMAGQEGAQCPIEAWPPQMQGDLSCDCLEALARQERPAPSMQCGHQSEQPSENIQPPECQNTQPPPAPEASVPEELTPEEPLEQPAPECPQTPDEPDMLPEADDPHRDNDLPRLWEEPQEATDRTARLRRQVMEALEGWQFYRHLARRTRGTDARVLNSMAGELHRHARKLSAAYFLLTGLRYWPSELLSTPAIPSYWGALRTRHQAEQRQEMAYRVAADDWDDPDLLEVYKELIEACQQRCRQLRTLLEQDTM